MTFYSRALTKHDAHHHHRLAPLFISCVDLPVVLLQINIHFQWMRCRGGVAPFYICRLVVNPFVNPPWVWIKCRLQANIECIWGNANYSMVTCWFYKAKIENKCNKCFEIQSDYRRAHMSGFYLSLIIWSEPLFIQCTFFLFKCGKLL